MSFRALSLVMVVGFLSGCAEYYLENQVRRVEGETRQLDSFASMQRLACPHWPHSRHGCTLQNTVQLAFNQADAYATAARQSAATQDAAFGVLLGTAGYTALGAANSVSDAVLTERVAGAAAVQQYGQRAVPRTSIRSLYRGASRMNCIAMAGSLYQEVNLSDLRRGDTTQTVPVQLASFLMVLAMREVEYRTLYGTARDLDDFSTLVRAFQTAAAPVEEGNGQGAVPQGQVLGPRENGTEPRTPEGTIVIQRNPALERFFGVVEGCLAPETLAPDRAAEAEADAPAPSPGN
jgi:hypothetical protein